MIKTDILSAADVPYLGAYYVARASNHYHEGKILTFTDAEAFASGYDLWLLTEEQFQSLQSTDVIIW